MVLINIDDEKYQENSVSFKLNDKTYTATDNDKVINDVMSAYAKIKAAENEYNIELDNASKNEYESTDFSKIENDTIAFSAKACKIQINLINELFGDNVGQELYKHYGNSTKRLSLFLADVLEELSKTKNIKLNKYKHKAKKVN